MSTDLTPQDYRPLVLLVDDDDDDVLLIQRALAAAAPGAEVVRADNGLDALVLLRKESPFEQARRPALVLLDLNMPVMGGREVLEQIKTDASLKSVPIVVLTTSDDAHDIAFCYQHHANSYAIKPVGLEETREVINAICGFWLRTAVTPRPAPRPLAETLV
ncbi:MAG: response regulator [Planctomycetales bacterium]|nr:response regulator [Planctomycetales bacterium]